MSNSYEIVLSRLDEFIRKYYKNRLIKGVLYALTLGLSFYITLVILAFYGNFNVALRAVLFYLFVAGNLYILGRYISIPLLKLYHIGHVLSYEDAARIIGRHFKEIQDKLLNILQLKSQEADAGSVALLEAGIEQKIKDMRTVPFTIAIDLSENKKYLRYLFIPVAILLFIWLVRPVLLKDGTKQIMHYSTLYAKPAPFQFVIENKNLQAIEEKDFPLHLKITGSEVPDEVYIQYNGNKFRLDKQNNVNFAYTFRNLQQNINFTFSAAGFQSQQYTLKVIPNPTLVSFDAKLHYPPYTGRKDETLHNTGDMSVPEGTVVTWNFSTQNTDNMHLRFSDTLITLNPSGDNQYTWRRRFLQSQNYCIFGSNKYITGQDSVKYAIQVIPDLYPSISVEKKVDSLSAKHLYFNGEVKDDYGFTRLEFIYRMYDNSQDSAAKPGITRKVNLDIAKNVLQQPFYFYWELDTLNLQPGQQIEYYFEVWDNDEVNGNKGTKSVVMYYKVPTLNQIQKATSKASDKLQSEISQSVEQSEVIQNQLKQERADLYNKTELNWADRKKLKDLINQQQQLQKKAEELSKQNQQNNEKQWEFQKKDSSLIRQQKQLQKLFSELAGDSLKKKLAELQKMLDKMNQNQVEQQLQKLSLNNEDLKKELQRTLELFKQLEFQQKLTQNIQKLDSLAQRQQKLSMDTKHKNASKATLQNKQDSLNKDFKQLSKNMQNLEKENNQMENPTPYKNPQQAEQNIEQQQQNSSNQLSKNKNSKASQSQQNASNGMQKLAQQMQSMQASMEQQSEEANENSLRAILNNLIQLSFGQEDLMNKVAAQERTGNASYGKEAKKQKELQEDAENVGDSLYALGKKVPQIQGIVNQQMSSVNYNMKKAISDMEQNKGFDASSRQQYSMTSVNNLSLMLSEVLSAMQSAAQNHIPGSGSCNKPGGKGSHPSMSQLQQMEQQLSQQLSQMKNAMEQQAKSGQQKNGQERLDEQLAKMAAQQEYIRNQMQQAEDEIDQSKKGGGTLDNIAKEMKKTQEDIINRQITQATMQRQQEIIKHFLEYQKAERTQGMQPNFESHVAKKQFFGNPNPFFEYNMLKSQQDELLKTVPPDFNTFYKNKVNNYFNSFQQQ